MYVYKRFGILFRRQTSIAPHPVYNTTISTYLKKIQKPRPLREEEDAVPLAHEIRQQSLQPLHLGRGKQCSFRQTEVPQAVKLGTDVVKIEVRVSPDFLRDLFIELRVVAVSSDTLSGTF